MELIPPLEGGMREGGGHDAEKRMILADIYVTLQAIIDFDDIEF